MPPYKQISPDSSAQNFIANGAVTRAKGDEEGVVFASNVRECKVLGLWNIGTNRRINFRKNAMSVECQRTE
eukprot:25444-Pelagomonas_calceolata.AAC.2